MAAIDSNRLEPVLVGMLDLNGHVPKEEAEFIEGLELLVTQSYGLEFEGLRDSRLWDDLARRIGEIDLTQTSNCARISRLCKQVAKIYFPNGHDNLAMIELEAGTASARLPRNQLEAQSEVLARMLNSQMREVSEGKLTLNLGHVDPAHAQPVLDFLSTGEIELNENNVMAIAELASPSRWMIPDLVSLCSDYLSDHLEDTDAQALIEVAHECDLGQMVSLASKILIRDGVSEEGFESCVEIAKYRRLNQLHVVIARQYHDNRPELLRLKTLVAKLEDAGNPLRFSEEDEPYLYPPRSGLEEESVRELESLWDTKIKTYARPEQPHNRRPAHRVVQIEPQLNENAAVRSCAHCMTATCCAGVILLALGAILKSTGGEQASNSGNTLMITGIVIVSTCCGLNCLCCCVGCAALGLAARE